MNQIAPCRILFSPPDIKDLEIEEVKSVMESGWITTGPRTKKLEKELAKYVGLPVDAPNVVCLNSATASEELNLRILGIGEGDEVLLPSYTYTSTASAVIHVGASVKFIDSQKGNYEMDYDAMEAAITENTKAIIPVDLGGIVCDYDRIYQAIECKKHLFTPSGKTDLGNRIQGAMGRIAVVSDCAHALGASKAGIMVGNIADFSSFSFHAVKNLTTAEGGASSWRSIKGVDDKEIYRQFQLYSLHGQSKDALAKTQLGAWEYDVVGPWYKCNMTDIMAAIGLKQLERYPELLERRRIIIGKYDDVCNELGVEHLEHYKEDMISSGHLYLTRIPGIVAEQRNEIIVKLAEKGVAANVHYKPLPMMTAYKAYGWDIKDFPNAYDYYHNLITLPLHTKLTDDDVEYVAEIFREIVEEYI